MNRLKSHSVILCFTVIVRSEVKWSEEMRGEETDVILKFNMIQLYLMFNLMASIRNKIKNEKDQKKER